MSYSTNACVPECFYVAMETKIIGNEHFFFLLGQNGWIFKSDTRICIIWVFWRIRWRIMTKAWSISWIGLRINIGFVKRRPSSISPSPSQTSISISNQKKNSRATSCKVLCVRILERTSGQYVQKENSPNRSYSRSKSIFAWNLLAFSQKLIE